jgi:SAM-dependent methyltransferase
MSEAGRDSAVFFNRTRRSASIPRKLLAQGRLLEIPLYAVLRQSDLAREGIERSGSWRFAAHIYRGEPSGRGAFGRWLDARLLSMPSARSFRNRYLAAADEFARFLLERADRPLDVLSVPCGLPLELWRGVRLAREASGSGARDPAAGVTLHGFDLDPEPLEAAEREARARGLPLVAHRADVFDRAAYPAADFITCTGLGEFLEDGQLDRLVTLLHDVLRPGGWFVITAMRRHWASDYLLRLGELQPRYRTGGDLEAAARRAGFQDLRVRTDDVGLQSILTARR